MKEKSQVLVLMKTETDLRKQQISLKHELSNANLRLDSLTSLVMLNETFKSDQQKANKLLAKLFTDEDSMRVDKCELLEL
jgi:hypothetical protein